jgi:hypothetical protein
MPAVYRSMNKSQIHWGNKSYEHVFFQHDITQDSALSILR